MAQKSKILAPVTIDTAGTREAITALELGALSVVIQADSLNTGKIYVGDSTVTSANGIEVAAGEAFVLTPAEGDKEVILSDIYVDTETNGNVVRIQYLSSRGA